MARDHIHFVTGRLAEHSLRRIVPPLADEIGFDYSVDVLPITVAALMTPPWIAARVEAPDAATRVVIPGYCGGDLEPVARATGRTVERGPRDLRQLPKFFSASDSPSSYGAFDIEIIAEINECPRLSLEQILKIAADFADQGADVIDVGCLPGDPWGGVGETVRALCDAGNRVSIDSLQPVEIAAAVAAGAELVLSVNGTNCHAAGDWGAEVIATPDVPATLAGLDATIDKLTEQSIPFRIDPILEPIGFGFSASLGRYLDVRARYPDAAMMMGIGNLTELTDVDSAGVNVMLLGFCQELSIHSVLTTQVINWARTSVGECDLARRLVRYAVAEQALPKHVEPRLVMLRDSELLETTVETFDRLANEIRDHDYRIFAAEGEVHVVGRNLHLHDADPFLLMERLTADATRKPLDAGHAFYLGYEMCKAAVALTLGKQYEQDEALDWGLATGHEARHYLKRGRAPEGEA
ncbi:DUF6513 domain-containing protein [Pirellulales bacterium]|nr:DUF6513 domain-containing protein [Pirellulales bacterium]